MPEIVRDDVLYYSISCKLKAQRKRKKERARLANQELPRAFEPMVPFGTVEQLSFSFVATAPEPVTSTTVPETPEASPSPPPSGSSTSAKPRSWLIGLMDRLKGEPSDKRTRQRSKDDGLDIV